MVLTAMIFFNKIFYDPGTPTRAGNEHLCQENTMKAVK